MKIAIFGLGYVGCVSVACLADMGHSVIGVDVNPQKLDMIRQGLSPIMEPGLDALLADAVKQDRLRVTSDAAEAVRSSELSMICVGTPSRGNGSINLQYLNRVTAEIGTALRETDTYHVVAVRSTVLPGATREELIPVLEPTSGRKAGVDFGVCVNPEFLREGSAVADFHAPPFTLIGELDEQSGEKVATLYRQINAPLIRTDMDTAAMVKYVSNAYHALKIVFANEIGTLCKTLGVDSHTVMEIFCQDKGLNISAAYLQPGFAFGGSCLPKDLRALLHSAKHCDIEVPVLQSIFPSNDLNIQRAINLVAQTGKKRVALLGLSFKSGTDDLRESPLVVLAEALIGKGYHVHIYDEEVSLSKLFGRNREYIEAILPHINTLLSTDLKAIINESDVLIMGKRQIRPETIRDYLRPDHTVVELVRSGDWDPAQQIGIAW